MSSRKADRKNVTELVTFTPDAISVLNHLSGSRAGVVGIYQRHDWAEEKRAALDAWSAHLLAAAEGKLPAGMVSPFSRADSVEM